MTTQAIINDLYFQIIADDLARASSQSRASLKDDLLDLLDEIERIQNKLDEEESFWQQVIAKDTMTMYNRYLRKYPNGKYVDEADKRLDEIESQE